MRAAKEFGPDAVVLDMMLPHFDGMEVLRRMRADDPNAGSAYGTLTVSIGVASHSGVAAADDTVQDLIHLADGRLYEAKAAGRNVVIPRQERPKLAVV